MAGREQNFVVDNLVALQHNMLALPYMVGASDINVAGVRAWYGPSGVFSNAGGGAAVGAAANQTLVAPFIPIFFGVQVKPTATIALQVLGTGGAGSLFRIGIFDGDQIRLRPTVNLFQSADLDGTVVTTQIITMGIPLISGRCYWLAYRWTVGSPTVRNLPASGGNIMATMGYNALSNQATRIGWIDGSGGAVATMPSPFGAGAAQMDAANASQMAHVMVEFA